MNTTQETSLLMDKLNDILVALKAIPSSDSAKPVMDTVEAAAYLGMSTEWLKKIRTTGVVSGGGGEAPKFIKMGKTVKYLKSDLDHFLNNRQKFENVAAGHTQQNFI